MLALVLSLVISGVSEHHLLKDVQWKTQQELPNTMVKSCVPLTAKQTQAIQTKIRVVEDRFNQYYNRSCNPGHLEIRIIKLAWLNSSEYFTWTDPKYLTLGRYFGERNILYITPEDFGYLNILEHELIHYLFDECNMRFDSDNQEHQQLEEFMRWKRTQ